MTQVYEAIFWDFDGVIVDSLSIKRDAFAQVLAAYDDKLIAQLLRYHDEFGGVSRFKKFNYFFHDILKKKIPSDLLDEYLDQFSKIVVDNLNHSHINSAPFSFISQAHRTTPCHIVSASEHFELQNICNKLEISNYFITINGSPKPKTDIIHNIIEEYSYHRENCVYIGDSLSDLESANNLGVNFLGYGNIKFIELGIPIVDFCRLFKRLVN